MGKSKDKKEETEHLYGKKSKLQSCKETLWNPETKEFFGRNGKNWCLLLIFYIIYYVILSGFFCASMYVFLTTMITYEKPYLTGQQSLLRGYPGLAHQSKISNDSALLKLKSLPSQYDNSTKMYLETVKKLFKDYPEMPENFTGNVWDCDRYDPILNKKFNVSKDVCGFALSSLKECRNYEKQLNQGQPCLFFKLNKIFGWLPSVKNESFTPSPLIQCTGMNPGDTENIGKVKYYPEYTDPKTGKKYGKISNNFFPFLTQKNYIAPLVAVQLRKVEKHALILMTCSLYGINKINKDDVTETVGLEFRID